MLESHHGKLLEEIHGFVRTPIAFECAKSKRRNWTGPQAISDGSVAHALESENEAGEIYREAVRVLHQEGAALARLIRAKTKRIPQGDHQEALRARGTRKRSSHTPTTRRESQEDGKIHNAPRHTATHLVLFPKPP